MAFPTAWRAVACAAMLASAAPAGGASPVAAQQADARYAPPEHHADWPQLLEGRSRAEVRASLDSGPELERGRTAAWQLDQHRRLDRALDSLAPQRPGVVDAYVVVAGLDSDPVFGREAREALRVLEARYDAAGRAIVLAGSDGSAPSDLPNGSPEALATVLARVAEVMDRREDVLILYTTGHGTPVGLAYHDGDEGYGLISPVRLRALLDGLGIRNRLLILSACFSGVFVPVLDGASTAIFTAAADDRTSFGCRAENDWTFFGDAMINHALRKPQPLSAAFDEAQALIGKWEAADRLTPSNPQRRIGGGVARWLAPLEARMPHVASAPVGRPATAALPEPAGER